MPRTDEFTAYLPANETLWENLLEGDVGGEFLLTPPGQGKMDYQYGPLGWYIGALAKQSVKLANLRGGKKLIVSMRVVKDE